MNDWSIAKAREVYNIEHWSSNFFDVNEAGHMIAYPTGKGNCQGVDIYEIVNQLPNHGLSLPLLIRFTDILRTRAQQLRMAFNNAITEYRYQGSYNAVYPIKVNQHRRVVGAILQNSQGEIGLEAGSKAELLAAIGLSTIPGSVVICNGYKDREYIRLALIGKALGHRVTIILEKFSELETILQEAEKMQIEPLLGLRIRLATIGGGRWQDSSGVKSKFGFSASSILDVIETLKRANKLHFLHMLHFHLGSQIANILHIQQGMRECARFYVELKQLGVDIDTVDVGGGLGVDYEGTRSRNSSCSMNYSWQEYANNIVYILAEICAEHNLPHPNIITEAGRAMTAHHAVLITNVIEMEPAVKNVEPEAPTSEENQLIKNFWDGYKNLNPQTALETYHDAYLWMQEVNSMYAHGVVNLAERARAEELYAAICLKVRSLLKPSVRAHREIADEINEKLADKFHANFSLFQSLPDAWAINQVFPIMPLHGLNQVPVHRAILQDITCDSDGRVELYVDNEGVETTLPLPDFATTQPFYIGIFLVGAYQEILGDMHNLFGDTDSVHVELQPDGSYQLVNPMQGDLVEDVLRYVHFDTRELVHSYRQQMANADLNPTLVQSYLQEVVAGLHGYTYLED